LSKQKYKLSTNFINRKAKEYHPDRNPSADAHDKFQEITKAYEELTKKIKQEEIDRKR